MSSVPATHPPRSDARSAAAIFGRPATLGLAELAVSGSTLNRDHASIERTIQNQFSHLPQRLLLHHARPLDWVGPIGEEYGATTNFA
jgi:hypothetical protein